MVFPQEGRGKNPRERRGYDMSYHNAGPRVSAETLPFGGICDLMGDAPQVPNHKSPPATSPNGSRANTRRTIGSKNSSGSDS